MPVRPVHSDPVSRAPEPPVTSLETDLLDAAIPRARRDGQSDGGDGARDDDLESHNTSVVFFIDQELVKPEVRYNYVALVLNQISLIDKYHAQQRKQRDQGLRPEALRIVRAAAAKNAEVDREQGRDTEDESQIQASMPDEAVSEDSAARGIMQKSLEDALEKFAEANRDKPGAGEVIILQVTEGDQVDGSQAGASEPAHHHLTAQAVDPASAQKIKGRINTAEQRRKEEIVVSPAHA